MAEIKEGDRVRVKDRPEWAKPPGYKLANSEGVVVSLREPEGFFVVVRLDKTEADIYLGTNLAFRTDAIEKI